MVEDNKNNEVTNADIMEFLKEHMVMKEDFDTRMDKVDVKMESLDARFFEFQVELEDIKARLDRIEKTLKEDTDVVVMEVEKLKKRVAVLEQQLGSQRATLVSQP